MCLDFYAFQPWTIFLQPFSIILTLFRFIKYSNDITRLDTIHLKEFKHRCIHIIRNVSCFELYFLIRFACLSDFFILKKSLKGLQRTFTIHPSNKFTLEMVTNELNSSSLSYQILSSCNNALMYHLYSKFPCIIFNLLNDVIIVQC